jgi:sugar phosphate isomerase/epimerase
MRVVRNRLSRREFCRRAGILGVSAAGLASAPAGGIEPILRTGGAHFKFSLAAYSYRDLLSGDSPPLSLEDFIADCVRMGLDGVELTSYYFPKDATDDYLRHLKQVCFLHGLDVSGTAVGNDFCHPPGPDRDRDIAHVKRWIEHADVLGAPVIRIFSGDARGDEAQAHKLAVAAIEECCEKAGRHGVMLALENHGGLTTTIDGILALVRDVQSPWFGVNLDTGNFTGSDVYGDLARLAPYAVNVQVKVMIRPGGGGKEPSDFDRLARILRDAGYRGYVVLEYEESEDPRTACPRYLDQLRAAFG